MSLITGAAYVRVSTEDQTEYSPDAQIRAIRDYAKKNDIIIPNEFVFLDEGISGRKAEKRPAFMRMIGMAKTKPRPFDVILVHKFDRFSRSREDSVVYKSLLRKESGIRVVSITESIEEDKFSVILESMLEAMAEYYSINLSEEVKKGMTEKAKRGEPQSIAPFGYIMQEKRFIINEIEAKIIKMIFDDFIGGMGYFDIARKINAMGIRTHRGNEFENRTVEYILRNPVYIGKLRWNPTERTRHNYNHPDLIVADSKHPPIIEAAVFEAAQDKVAQVKSLYKKYYKPQYKKVSHWLVGLVVCGDCGGAMVNQGTSFQCNSYMHGRCSSHSVSIKKMVPLILEQMLAYSKSDANAIIPVGIISKDSEKNETSIINEQLARAEQKLIRVQQAFEAGIDTIAEYKANKDRVQSEIESIKNHLASTHKPAKTNPNPFKRQLFSAYIMLSSPDVPNEEKAASAHSFIKNIVYDKQTNEFAITFFISK